MPRQKTLPDEKVLEAALGLLHRAGPEALTFASLAAACGLSSATLVQRFENKAKLKQATLLHAWDRLDSKTAELAAIAPKTPEGAIGLLVALSRDYGGIESYAEGLLVLREDLRDPVLRARGAAWKVALARALDECLSDLPHVPPGIGLLMASQWQGSLLWWGFDPRGKVDDYVEEGLRHFVSVFVAEGPSLRTDTGRRKRGTGHGRRS
jgi:AcrR family transcriptional regulator